LRASLGEREADAARDQEDAGQRGEDVLGGHGRSSGRGARPQGLSPVGVIVLRRKVTG
jgi:hypothetical protein